MRWLALALVVRSATTTTCPGTTPTDDTPSPVAGCSFDEDWCGWNATSNEGTRWTLGTETTPTRFTGPNEGVNGTGYAYVEASHPNHPSVVFELTSPLFEAPVSTLSFAYSMYGAAMGSLAVDTYVNAWICDVWLVEGNLGDAAWRSSGVIDVSSATRIRIRAVTGAGAAGDAAVDNVVVTAAPAPSMKPSMSLRPSIAPSRTPGSPTSSPVAAPTPAPITIPETPAPSRKAVVASSSSSKDSKQSEEDALGDPDAASTSGLVYILGGCLLALSCGLLGAVRLKHCNKPKPPLHVELGLKKRSEAGPPPKVQRDEDAMRLRRQELGAMAWSSDESDDDEEAQKRDEENRTALFRRQPSSLETRSQKQPSEDAELERALARAEAAERRRAAGDAELERALAASKVTAAAEASHRARPASPEDMAMSSEDEELEVREHPEFSPQKLALYDDLDRSRRSASPILRVPSPAGGALLSEASIKRAQQSSRASSPRISEASLQRAAKAPSPLFGRSASPFSGDSWGPSAASDGDWPSPEPSPDARPPPPPWTGDASPGSFEARRFSEKADDVAASDGSASSGWPDAT
ncbi:unnamed protein product [Pelagomonas calceolata]|uniref:MAM domain-containing protein n=1 Tax=Pelagomonas calceolata TaxID=35677 RepID=A0A7S4EBY0_9STRA|nr:unnamed protein product [Pelagomonas calceolata]